ncbi:hypothetical protein AERO8C_130038 [Aeromonas veronii]|uniref:Uncharacterized protein n=1 Tax=Aeromonas veronii TaxID=654 RepID=A0A653KSQ5_AERVE|nr:hypothetical protein AERO8C_130038 [Aeromonas veronii]
MTNSTMMENIKLNHDVKLHHAYEAKLINAR